MIFTKVNFKSAKRFRSISNLGKSLALKFKSSDSIKTKVNYFCVIQSNQIL
jgi:hypothetical protein